MNKMTTTIRYSADASICLIDDGDQFRAPTQEDMDTLPVGDDLTEDEIASIENDVWRALTSTARNSQTILRSLAVSAIGCMVDTIYERGIWSMMRDRNNATETDWPKLKQSSRRSIAWTVYYDQRQSKQWLAE
jgi:hypothetical protein